MSLSDTEAALVQGAAWLDSQADTARKVLADWLSDRPDRIGPVLAQVFGRVGPPPADPRFARTEFVVEATGCEVLHLWDAYDGSDFRWEQDHGGLAQTVGHLVGLPVILTVSWARLNGRLVMFCHPISRVVDTEIVESWLDKYLPGRPRCDAMNFHLCRQFVQDGPQGG